MKKFTLTTIFIVLLVCVSCESLSPEERAKRTYGGIKVVSGKRGHPSRIYFTKGVRLQGTGTDGLSGFKLEANYVIEDTSSRFNIEVGYEFSSDVGIHHSDRLNTSTIIFLPVRSQKQVKLEGGIDTDLEVRARLLSQDQFQREADLWLEVLGNRNPSEGVLFDEFEKALASVRDMNPDGGNKLLP